MKSPAHYPAIVQLAQRPLAFRAGLVFGLTATLLGGCATPRQEIRYIAYQPTVQPERVRIPACNPFYADELMRWATELDPQGHQHERKARVLVDQRGQVTCGSRETAGSQSKGR